MHALRIIYFTGAMAKCVILTTSIPSTPAVEANQNSLRTLLRAKSVGSIEEIDGAQAEFSARRNELFGISGKRGVYPQVFAVTEAGETTFIGDWEAIEGFNECSDLPAEILEGNPSIVTFEKAFAAFFA